ncbi:MAG TPA: peptide chain release factor N(5)-glutamine methyltransferase, partial [Chthoniobacteraceae bacterium]
HLLAHALGKKRMDLYMEFDRPLSDAELEPLRALVRRRALGEPLQHLLGTAEFYGRVFNIDKRALIPRQETEQLVDKILEISRDWKNILELGVGSGAIALTLAAELPSSTVLAVDISNDALELAKTNAERLGVSERVRFQKGDLLAGVEGEFDLIVANLPYIAPEVLPTLSREVQHDPVLALNGGAGGIEILLRLIAEAPHHLRGQLALEIGHDQLDALSAELRLHKYQDIRGATDYQGRNRFLFAKYG